MSTTPAAYNIPNLLTYGRILAVPLIVLCFFIEGRLQSSDTARWTALGLFAVASITDFFDGYLARIWQQTSNIGRMLDPIADKLLVASVLLLVAADGTIAGWSIWAAIIILCREILVSGLREYLAALKVSVPVTPHCEVEDDHPDGRHRLPAGRPPPATRCFPTRPKWASALLWLAAAITLYTGYDYFRAGLKHMVD